MTEIIIVVVILGLLVTVALSAYGKVIRRTGFREVTRRLNLLRAGARYYDLKYGLNTLAADETAWDALKVDKPSDSGANLTYVITSSASGNPELEISYGGSVLYEYDLIDETGTTSADPNAAYLPDDLP